MAKNKGLASWRMDEIERRFQAGQLSQGDYRDLVREIWRLNRMMQQITYELRRGPYGAVWHINQIILYGVPEQIPEDAAPGTENQPPGYRFD